MNFTKPYTFDAWHSHSSGTFVFTLKSLWLQVIENFKGTTMKLRHLLITTCLLTGFGAMAQSTANPETTNPAPEARPAGPMQKMRDMMAKHHARHLEELKTSLKLKPEQDSAWTTFASSMKPHTPDAQDRVDLGKLTTPERIDKMRAIHAQHDAEMQKRGDATKAFYATLSDEQKKTFDQHTAKFMHRMGGEHHAGHGMGHGHVMPKL